MVAEVRTQFGRHGAVINALIDSTEVETPGKRRRTVIPTSQSARKSAEPLASSPRRSSKISANHPVASHGCSDRPRSEYWGAH